MNSSGRIFFSESLCFTCFCCDSIVCFHFWWMYLYVMIWPQICTLQWIKLFIALDYNQTFPFFKSICIYQSTLSRTSCIIFFFPTVETSSIWAWTGVEDWKFDKICALSSTYNFQRIKLSEHVLLFLVLICCVVQDDRSKHWRVQAVAVSPDRFESRRPLPAQWRGLRDEELSKESGIPGCVFVHMSGFIGGNQTYEGALAMAKHALKL